MNETLHHIDQTPLFSELVYERLLPQKTPEMGFQAYEKLDGSKAERDKQQKAFLAKEVFNPKLDYPKLDHQELELKKIPLELIYEQAGDLPDSQAAEAVRASASYRIDEMTWLQKAIVLNALADENPKSDEYIAAAKDFQASGEKLYGIPDATISAQVYGEIFAQASEKDLDPRAEAILHELQHGTTLSIAGEEVTIPALADKALGRLPKIDAETLAPLAEVLKEDTEFIADITKSYWEDVILPRSKATGKEPGFNVQDMYQVFTAALAVMDPEGKSGVSIKIVEDKSVLSWDTPTMSVEIGASRAAITDPLDMQAKITHELWKHGGSAIEGLKSGLPVLGTGVYTEADYENGERPDYLTFEEGIAGLSEMAVNGKDIKWTAVHLSRHLALASTYDGADFRTAFEINWRARVLQVVKSGEELTDAIIEKEQKQAYLSVLRIRRGTPTHLKGGPIVSYNKDLAYLDGKLIASSYLKKVGRDKTKIRRMFTSKTDPTNPRQEALAIRYERATGE